MLYGVAFLHSTVQVIEEVCQSLLLKLVDCPQMHNNVVGTLIFRSSTLCILVFPSETCFVCLLLCLGQ